MPKRTVTANGYVRLGGIYEHRAVAARLLGRPLGTDEHVHHRNGDRQDNRPENLEVLTAAEHVRRHARTRRPMTRGLPWPQESV